MIRTSTRTRAILALAVAGAGLPASSALAITTPETFPLPAFTEGTAPTYVWAPATFDAAFVSNERYQVSVRNLTTGSPAVLTSVAAPDITLPLTLQNGHQYAVRVRAQETVDPPGPPPAVTVSSDWSPEQVTRVDATAPAGTFEIAGGAQYVSTPDVTLTLNATDPLSAGFTPSGVSRYQVSNGATFPCPGGSGPSCPKPYSPSVAHQLAEGPDGPRTVRLRFRDASRPMFALFATVLGNESATHTDTVLLDRLAPTANLAPIPPEVLQGTPLTFDASTSVDGASGPNDSGVDPASYQWQFGDGTSGGGVTQSHTYGAPGTYNGTLTIHDRAGNSATKPFQVKVTAPAPPQGPTTAGQSDLSLGKIQVVGKVRALRAARIRVSVSAAVGLRGKLTRTVRGRTTAVKRFRAAGGPGLVTMSFRAPKAGLYRIEISAGDLSRSRGLRVTR
jgi:hypothetical protein